MFFEKKSSNLAIGLIVDPLIAKQLSLLLESANIQDREILKKQYLANEVVESISKLLETDKKEIEEDIAHHGKWCDYNSVVEYIAEIKRRSASLSVVIETTINILLPALNTSEDINALLTKLVRFCLNRALPAPCVSCDLVPRPK